MTKIFLDAGHGGFNPGAIGANGLEEAPTNLDIVLKLGRILESWGYQVAYSRTTDVYLSLEDRAIKANNWGADYFISVHCNANPNTALGGTSTFYYNKRAITERFALVVNNALVEQIQLRDIGIFTADFAVLRLTRMSAILVEVAFLSNPYEESLLATNSFRQNCALGIANGVAEFTT
ncbi:MAG: N-acetylmuramoyl-L-alanine amidase [bacterium]